MKRKTTDRPTPDIDAGNAGNPPADPDSESLHRAAAPPPAAPPAGPPPPFDESQAIPAEDISYGDRAGH